MEPGKGQQASDGSGNREQDTAGERDSDLEIEDTTNNQPTRTISTSSFLSYMNEAGLNLNHCGLGPTGAKALASVLQGDFLLKELDLSHNRLCEGEHLGCMLAKNLGLEVLNLSWNHIRTCGALALSDGLKANATLKRLHLSWNGFGRREAESLGDALKLNRTLVLLDLSSNRLDDGAVALLCRGLAANEGLRILKLSHNPMSDAGALTLLRTIQSNARSAMEEVDISTVFVRETFIEMLEGARRTNPALTARYSVMRYVLRNVSALHSFQESLKERRETILDFFQALDEEGTMSVSTSAFRKAVKAANIAVDQRQLDWLIRSLDKDCTATINYSHYAVTDTATQMTSLPRRSMTE
ncbi:leucine-rich repeat-containing protein 74A-like isoform X2 [Betta splendens]|uniref:Leucine-rich repeat-containing protein 74A-like isoform X2 n=1 Tax=Betta splendens TaxID=158456 RepID=A0A6P7LUL8_BETSP|nr:leucine-rich repeat-containing protein 74A-like isoform X2 [Betta splendens]